MENIGTKEDGVVLAQLAGILKALEVGQAIEGLFTGEGEQDNTSHTEEFRHERINRIL